MIGKTTLSSICGKIFGYFFREIFGPTSFISGISTLFVPGLHNSPPQTLCPVFFPNWLFGDSNFALVNANASPMCVPAKINEVATNAVKIDNFNVVLGHLLIVS